jgi:hypothetical protein
MQRHIWFATVLTLGAAALALPLACRAPVTDETPCGPKSLDEVVQIAHELKLYHRYVGGPGSCCVVVTAKEPHRVLWEGPRLNNPRHQFWNGTVAIYTLAHQMWGNYDPACSLVWGDLFVYGDPDVIEMLTGRRP